MLHIANIINSTIASSVQGWRGTSSSQNVEQPDGKLFLFDREGDPACRLVRETITSLNLDVMIMPCPLGGANIKQLAENSGTSEVPVLYDANVEEQRIGANEIIQYLYKQYRGCDAPERVRVTKKRLAMSKLSSLTRLNAGTIARPSRGAAQPLRLYSFESSPFSRIVRELLCELELPYELVTLGKQQRADMGPAKLRFNVGAYVPIPGSKREAFNAKHGNVQVPFLEDPNTGVELFESQVIVGYLKREYAL